MVTPAALVPEAVHPLPDPLSSIDIVPLAEIENSAAVVVVPLSVAEAINLCVVVG